MNEAQLTYISVLSGTFVGLAGGELFKYFGEIWKRQRLRKTVKQDLSAMTQQLATVQKTIKELQKLTKEGITVQFQYDIICKLTFQKIFPQLYDYYSKEERQCLSVVSSAMLTIEKALVEFPFRPDSALPTEAPYKKKIEARLTALDGLSAAVSWVQDTVEKYLSNDIKGCMESIATPRQDKTAGTQG